MYLGVQVVCLVWHAADAVAAVVACSCASSFVPSLTQGPVLVKVRQHAGALFDGPSDREVQRSGQQILTKARITRRAVIED